MGEMKCSGCTVRLLRCHGGGWRGEKLGADGCLDSTVKKLSLVQPRKGCSPHNGYYSDGNYNRSL